jgi:bifunctional non-homologous end joining protein LigD
MRLRLVKQAFDDPDYIFELKHDGFRAVAYLENRQCKLISRSFKQLRFASLAKPLATLPAADAIIDGEIVCLDASGVSRFNELLNRKAEPQVALELIRAICPLLLFLQYINITIS